jgi:PAS domain S-box-containing protein
MRVKTSSARTIHLLTECERMESRLAAHSSQQFIEQMPAAIAIFDDQMRYRAVSRRYLFDLAWLFSTEVFAPEQVIGRTFHEVSPDMPPRWGDAHARALAGEDVAQEEDFVPRQDGRAVWVRWSIRPWRNENGRIGGALLFSELITEQVEIKHALAESELRSRATFDNAAVGISHVAPNGRLLRANKAMSRILGWPADELLTKMVQDITHPDDLPVELVHLQQLIDGKVGSYTMDKRDYRKDGTVVWIRRTVSAVRHNDGSINYFVSVVEDISARKHAEEQVHLLMREANHRVKNLLSLVQVIARQTAAGDPEDFVERFARRIKALAANQDLLGRDQKRGADLEDLTHAQLAPFADLIGRRIAVHGPKLHLNAAAAQAIGLALHELATNAGKYGALSTDAGHVDVDWQLDDGRLSMNWMEHDGPPVQPPARRGFGNTVIDTMVKRTVDGEVKLDYSPPGLEWHLTCPAANVLEPETNSGTVERR